MKQVCSVMLAVAIVTKCLGQGGSVSSSDPTRHLERDLQGPRLESETGSPTNLVEAATHESAFVRDSGIISVITLRHKMPTLAQQSFVRATKYSKKKDYKAAAAELQKALAVDPEFVEARANLGVQYFRLGLLDRARTELERAIERDPNISAVHTNLAIVFLEQGNVEMAVAYARRALKLAVNNRQAHYVLGLALRGSPDSVLESIVHLQVAAERFPDAKRELARLQSLNKQP